MLSGLESPTHLIIILVLLLLLFGAKRVPELGKGLGKGLREFKQGMNASDEPEEKEKHRKAVDKGQNDEESEKTPDEETGHAKASKHSEHQ